MTSLNSGQCADSFIANTIILPVSDTKVSQKLWLEAWRQVTANKMTRQT